MAQLMSGEAKNQNIPGLDAILRGEILRKDGLIRQLMEQNKMLLATKERQEVEMAAINETLEVKKKPCVKCHPHLTAKRRVSYLIAILNARWLKKYHFTKRVSHLML